MKVLVVEDNEKLLKLLGHLLEKEGYEVFAAGGGPEGLALYEQHKPEVLCLDVLMEGSSGLDVCRTVRQKDKRAIILIITSRSRDVDIEAAKAAGANDYIVKPFDTADITARMRTIARNFIARETPDLVAASFAFGDITVFPGQIRAERAGENLDLNLRDIGLLKLFYERRGAAVANGELRNYCWMTQSPDADKAVNWYIGHLRKKIEKDPENPVLIRPAAEGGYRHD
jgi:DNA-binding response OmpR family regulator